VNVCVQCVFWFEFFVGTESRKFIWKVAMHKPTKSRRTVHFLFVFMQHTHTLILVQSTSQTQLRTVECHCVRESVYVSTCT